MSDSLKFVLMVVVGILAVIGLITLLERFNQTQRDFAWENRPKIGFQPTPDPATAAPVPA